MFYFASAVRLRPAVIVTTAIRCVERNLSIGRPFLGGGYLRNLNTCNGSTATIQVKGIKKRTQRRKPISVDDIGQIPGVSTSIQNSHRSLSCMSYVIYLGYFSLFRTSIIVYLLVDKSKVF
jgi:hypothetical protein